MTISYLQNMAIFQKGKLTDNEHVSQCSTCSACKNGTLWNVQRCPFLLFKFLFFLNKLKTILMRLPWPTTQLALYMPQSLVTKPNQLVQRYRVVYPAGFNHQGNFSNVPDVAQRVAVNY